MDRKELVESSNSQNVNLTVQSIQERGNSGSLLVAVLSEGSSFFMAPQLLTAADSWISPAAQINQQRLERLIELDTSTRCRQKALDLLARRGHARLELKQKLQKREFPLNAINETLDWLEEKKYLNDKEFAQSWLKSRLNKGGESLKSLDAGLRKKGISSIIIKELLIEIPPEQQIESLKKQWGKFMRRSSMTQEKAIASLIRKGFSYSMIRSMLEENDDPSE